MRTALLLTLIALVSGCDSEPSSPPITPDASPGSPDSSQLRVGSSCTITYNSSGYPDPCVAAKAGYCVPSTDISYANSRLSYNGTALTGFCQSDCHLSVKPTPASPAQDVEIPLDESCATFKSPGTSCLLHVLTDSTSKNQNVIPSCSAVNDPIYECSDNGSYVVLGKNCKDGSICHLVNALNPTQAQVPSCGK